MRASAAVAFSVLASHLAVLPVEAGCSADSQSGECQVTTSPGDAMLSLKKDVASDTSAQEEATLHEKEHGSSTEDVASRTSAQEEATLHEKEHGSRTEKNAATAAAAAAADSKREKSMVQVTNDKAHGSTGSRTVAHSSTGSRTVADGAVDEATERMCKDFTITIHKAEGLPTRNTTIYPFVKVGFKTSHDQAKVIQTAYKTAPPFPAVWNHSETMLVCNKNVPLHFEVYDEGYVLNTLLAEAELDASQYWNDDFSGSVMFEDGAKGQLQVTIVD